MCGITGICNYKYPQKISPQTLKQMTDTLRHRGPDERGIYLDDWVGLGHARLSIVDLTSGIQPMHNEDETKWLICNGEIYNYPELRADLLKLGHHFYTKSDSEVILHLYEEYGEKCLFKLNGQFALAIWDSKKKELFLARDHVGIRPLYYTIKNDSLFFASEIKALFTNNEIKREINPIALDQIFTFWAPLPGHTPFKDIEELPPAHFMKISKGKIRIEKYWDLPFQPENHFLKKSLEETTEELYSLLNQAIKIRIRADVEVGTYLSGGLDSSAVSSIVAKDFNRDVNTFGIRFTENIFDEGDFQSEVVSYLNSNHHEIRVSNEDIGSYFSEVIWHCEKPILRTAPVPLFLLSREVREKQIKVVLTGEGADEVFGGYNIFREAKIRRFWAKQPNSKKRANLIGKLYPYIFSDPRQKVMLQSFFARGLDEVDSPFFSHLVRWNNTARIKTFFSDELNRAIGVYDGYEELKQNLPLEFNAWDGLSKAQYLESAIFMSNYLLSSQGDRVAMAHSVEIRLPFLDPRLMEFMGRVPPFWKIRGLNEKYILKKSLAGKLPAKIINRPKHPFRAPIVESLLNQQTGEYTKEMLSDNSLKLSGLFNPSKVFMLLNKLSKTKQPSEIDSMSLVAILSSQILYHQFIKEMPVNKINSSDKWFVVDRRSETV